MENMACRVKLLQQQEMVGGSRWCRCRKLLRTAYNARQLSLELDQEDETMLQSLLAPSEVGDKSCILQYHTS